MASSMMKLMAQLLPSETDMSTDTVNRELSAEDQRLVRLLITALANPRIHVEIRTRLRSELTWLLRPSPEDATESGYDQMLGASREAHIAEIGRLLETALTDPHLHTGQLSRLHVELSELLAPDK